MKNVVIVILAILFFNKTYAQAPTIQWQNTIGGLLGDVVTNTEQTLDGGYIISGRTNSTIGRDKTEIPFGTFDFWIVKINDIGDIQWQKTFGGNLYNDGPIIKQNTDGTYILAGTSNSNISGNKTVNTHGGDDIWLLKLDSTGNILWQKSIGGSSKDSLADLIILSNNNILIGTSSISPISGDKTEINFGLYDYWVIELDSDANILWQKTLGGSNNDNLSTFQKISDDGYIIGGFSSSGISGNKTENSYGQNDYWIIKLDANKNIEWQKTIGGNNEDQFASIYQTNDNGFIIGGSSYSGISGLKTEPSKGSDDFWVMKLDSFGSILWQKTIGGINSDGIASIDKTLDGYFLLCGNSSSPISGDKTEYNRGLEDIWIVKIDENGTIIWDKTVGGNDQDYTTGKTIKHTNDNGIIVGASSKSDISGDKTEYTTSTDYWILKLSPDDLSNNTFDASLFSIYPNPTSGIINIKSKSSSDNYTITISNIIGQIINQQTNSLLDSNTTTIDGQSGVYFITIENQEKQKRVFKIIKK